MNIFWFMWPYKLTNKCCQTQQILPHCRVLPPSEFNDTIPIYHCRCILKVSQQTATVFTTVAMRTNTATRDIIKKRIRLSVYATLNKPIYDLPTWTAAKERKLQRWVLSACHGRTLFTTPDGRTDDNTWKLSKCTRILKSGAQMPG